MKHRRLELKKNQIKVFVACLCGYEFTDVVGVALKLDEAKQLYKTFRRQPSSLGDRAAILEAPLGSEIANPLYGCWDDESSRGYKWHQVKLEDL